MNTRATRVMLATGLLFAIGGCSDENGGNAKIRQKEGIAKKIDLQNRVVSMTCLNKQGKEYELSGTFTEDTEVLINGRTQTMKDVRPGDKVKVFGKKVGKGDEEKLVATRVIITRPEAADWKETGQGGAKKEPDPVKPTG